jgi:lactoylglutathione lyase
MGKLTFDHIHLFTRDPEATATFYERMFGPEVIRSTQEGRPRIDQQPYAPSSNLRARCSAGSR